MSVAENKKNIAANRRRIFELENQVQHNRALAHLARSLVSENTALIQSNYQAAFQGNRRLIEQNIEDAFRNRLAIVRHLPEDSDVATNFKAAKTNQIKLEFIDYRAKANERMIAITAKLSEVNKQLIEINKEILEANEEYVQFTSHIVGDNTKLLAEGRAAPTATPASNAELIAANKARIDEIAKRATANSEALKERIEKAKHNRSNIETNAKSIQERRDRICEAHTAIEQNQHKIAEFIESL